MKVNTSGVCIPEYGEAAYRTYCRIAKDKNNIPYYYLNSEERSMWRKVAESVILEHRACEDVLLNFSE